MSWQRLRAIVYKETMQFLRDRRSLISILVVPLLQLVLYGYLSSDIKHQPTIVFDQSKTTESRDLIRAFVNTEYFAIAGAANSMREVERAIDAGKVMVGIVIPPDYASKLRAGQDAQVMVAVDATDATAARVSLSVATGVGASIAQQVAVHQLELRGGHPTIGTADVRTRAWYNPDLRSEVFIVPGVLAVVLQFSMTFLSILAIVRERELGTLEQLVVTPIRSSELMLGKIIPIVGIGYVICTLILIVSWALFRVPVQGNIITLYLVTLGFFFSTIGIGMLVSTVSSSFQQAMQLAQLFLLPGILLSGFIFPRESLPLFLQWVGALMPLTYFLTLVRGVIVKGVGLEFIWPQILALAVLGAVVFTFAVFRFQKKIG
jgi:drug efflux transport system permease protein